MIAQVLTGKKIPFYQDGIRNPSADGAFWRQANLLCDFSGTVPPVHIVTGYMCIDTCTGMRADICMDICMDMCMGMCIDMCMDMRMAMRMSMCMDMCMDMSWTCVWTCV